MVIRNIALLVLIFLLIGTASPQGTGELDGFTTGSGLTGQVVDVLGRGISGAKVWIIGGEGQAINTSTNATGHYGLNLPPSNYTITAELSGYSFTSSTAQVQAGTVSIAQRITGYAAGTVPTATENPNGAQPPTGTQVPSGFYTTINIVSEQYRGYTISVDGQQIGVEGQGQDVLDGRYTFTVTGNQQHLIRIDHPMNWKWWQGFYNAGDNITYYF